MNKRESKYLKFLGLAIFVLLILALIFWINPDKIVTSIGVKNTYLIAFLIAATGGLSTLTSTSFFTAIVTFASGGSNPWLLGLAGGLGIFLSDSIFFFTALYGKKLIPDYWQRKVANLTSWIYKTPPWVVIIGIFCYISFTPLPNDILMIALAAAGYRYQKLAPILLAGSITISTLLSHLGKFGLSYS